jgi:hypothetical protein
MEIQEKIARICNFKNIAGVTLFDYSGSEKFIIASQTSIKYSTYTPRQ